MEEYCKKPGFALAYFYFDFSDPGKQEVSNFVSSLITQLCSEVVSLPDPLRDLYKRRKNGKEKAALHELKEALSGAMKNFEDVFIVVDALDECPKNGERGELLKSITEIKSWLKSNLHLLATSRREPDIEEVLMSLAHLAIPIQGPGVELDIKLHVERQLATDRNLKKWPSDIKSEIKHTLVAGANGM
jgi:ankyrin repeat domain-containing protein 50